MKRRPYENHGETPQPEVTEGQVIAHLATLRESASIREIAHGMGLKHGGRRYLPRVIERLKRSKQIEEHRGRFRLAGARPAERTQRAPETKAPEPSALRRSVPEQARKPARDRNVIPGRIVVHRDGYGFVVPDQPIPNVEGDLFIGRDGMGDAMHGDRVLARIERRRPDGRAEGRIVQIVEREHPTIVGLFRYGPRENTVLPYDARIPHEILIPPGAELADALRSKLGEGAQRAGRRLRLPELEGAVVNAEITKYPKGGLAPVGRVIEILGRPGEIGVDVEIMIRKHHLPHTFDEDVLAEARQTPQQVREADLAGRRDFRQLPIVTIDGDSARDFDDAVCVASLPHGHYELQVHIADVAHYVRRATPLDREARLRGTSVYFPNRAVPMLPEELSNGICSLNPKVDRLVMSAVMEMDASGAMVRAEFMPGVIRSAERMTYTNVQKVLDGDPEMTGRYAGLAHGFQRMKELALLLNRRRNGRGSIDFDLPERVIEFDDEGRMLSIVRGVRNFAHRIIEEFMLAANEAVAGYLEQRGIASLHRVHEKPDPRRVLEFEELAHAFGYSLGVEDLAERRIAVRHGEVRAPSREGRRQAGRMKPMTVSLPAEEVAVTPRHYQRLTEKIAGRPEERILSYLMLRSLKQARYAAEPLGHFALAAREYTHFTSPIRRYPDLIVHRALKWALENSRPSPQEQNGYPRDSFTPPAEAAAARGAAKSGEAAPGRGPYRRTELEEIASESSEAERRADGAERELLDWKTAQFMESHLGEEYDALIISVQKFGFFVELMDIFVEGLVGMDRLEETTGQRCVYRERDHAIVSEPGRGARGRGGPGAQRIFRLGDRVRVRAERIEPLRRRAEFALVGASETSRANPSHSGRGQASGNGRSQRGAS